MSRPPRPSTVHHMDLRDILRRARAAGLEPRLGRRSGHWGFYDAEGRRVATTGSTPSDRRAALNLLGNLRRAGYDLRRQGKRRRA